MGKRISKKEQEDIIWATTWRVSKAVEGMILPFFVEERHNFFVNIVSPIRNILPPTEINSLSLN